MENGEIGLTANTSTLTSLASITVPHIIAALGTWKCTVW